MELEKGRLIGKGKTAEVYKWGQDRVLKLYFEKFSENWVNREAMTQNIVHEAGVDCPAVFEVVEINGRRGMITQRVYGRSLLKCIADEPWRLFCFVRQIARMQYGIHKFSASGLPSQMERFAYTFSRSSEILGGREERILKYMGSLTDGSSVCHGDLHFNNIMASCGRLVAIDWNSAYCGNPHGDVARTFLILSSPSVPAWIPETLKLPYLYVKWLASVNYLNEYMRLSKASFKEIDAWTLPVAAARLKDNAPGERAWLMGIIDQRIGKLCPSLEQD